MAADTENLVLDHLRHIRARVDQITDTATKPPPGNKSLSTGWPPAWNASSADWS